MRFRNIILLSCCIILIIATAGAACAQKPAQGFIYDPSKSYASFLVVNSEYGKTSLASMKAHTTEENYEIGPIEYYNPGTKDFEPALTRLTGSKQVKIVWIVSSIYDVNEIKKAIAKLDYAGAFRYAPIYDQVGPLKVQQ
jgi:hypothetical protein